MPDGPRKARPPMTDRQIAGWCIILGLVFGGLEGRMLYWHGASHDLVGVIGGCLVGIAVFFVIRHRRNRYRA